MATNGREFLKLASIGGVAASTFGFDLEPANAQLKELKIARAAETRSTCPYLEVGWRVLINPLAVRAKNVAPQLVRAEGDPDHPTSREYLVRCSAGAWSAWVRHSRRRLAQPGE